MKPSKFLLRVLFSLVASVLVITVLFTYLTGGYVYRANREMAAQRAVMEQLNLFLSTLKDAETGQRGYLLTGKEQYLQPYEQAVQRLGNEQNILHGYAARGDLAKGDVQKLDGLVAQKLAELALTVHLRRTNAAAALVIVETDKGKAAMDGVRIMVADWLDREKSQYEDASRHARHALVAGTVIFLLAGLTNLGVVAWAFRKISSEMTGREAAVLEMIRQKELLSTTLASIGDGVVVTNDKGFVTFMNGEAERLTGWKNAEAQGQSLPTIFRIINETSRQPVENPVEKVLKLGIIVGLANHTLLIAKDGSEIPIDDSAAPIRHLDGPLFGVVLVFRDFSEHKKAEHTLKEAQEQLKAHADGLEKTVEERTAKLREMIAELQHVSYAITHDMRAPLRAMSSYATLLMEECKAPETAQQYCRRITVAAARLDKLITDALMYTKAVLLEVPMQPVDLSLLIEGMLETYPNFHPDKAGITIEGELPMVLGNESLLTQCFSNLLGNATKFVEPGVRPDVKIHAETSGDFVTVTVRDNGIGIPLNAQSRLFGMFQKLDDQYEGTGIGLAIVRKVTERMGGKVSAQSEPGKGSTFSVELRRA